MGVAEAELPCGRLRARAQALAGDVAGEGSNTLLRLVMAIFACFPRGKEGLPQAERWFGACPAEAHVCQHGQALVDRQAGRSR